MPAARPSPPPPPPPHTHTTTNTHTHTHTHTHTMWILLINTQVHRPGHATMGYTALLHAYSVTILTTAEQDGGLNGANVGGSSGQETFGR
eukprot:jgi/Mesvir1/28972/Mv25703-RA.1